MRKKLSTSQIVSISLLWVALCIMLFTIPSSSSFGEKIFIAIVSGFIILIGISKGNNAGNRSRRSR